MISKNVVVVASPEQVSSEVSEEVVILHLKSGTYYGLNAVGNSIWNLIQQPKSVEEIQKALLDEYEVDPKQCDRDLIKILEELASHNLIKITNDTQVVT